MCLCVQGWVLLGGAGTTLAAVNYGTGALLDGDLVSWILLYSGMVPDLDIEEWQFPNPPFFRISADCNHWIASCRTLGV